MTGATNTNQTPYLQTSASVVSGTLSGDITADGNNYSKNLNFPVYSSANTSQYFTAHAYTMHTSMYPAGKFSQAQTYVTLVNSTPP